MTSKLYPSGGPIYTAIRNTRQRFQTPRRLCMLAGLLLCSILSIKVSAQAPIITIQQGLPTGGASALRAIAYGNGKYIAGGNYSLTPGLVYISSDGENWARVIDADIPANITFTGAGYGNGTFVMVGNAGMIIKSANGLDWSTATSGTVNDLYNVTFISNAFYAIGANATLLKSTDGSTWTPVTVNGGSTSDSYMHITYGNGYFVIGGRTGSGSEVRVYRSATGASNSWTYYNVDAVNSLNKICFLKDKFYIFTSSTNVLSSTNAATWSDITSTSVSLPTGGTTTLGTPNQAFGGIYDGTNIYFYGSTSAQSYCSITTSSNGTSFALQPKSVGIVGQNMAYLNGKYFILGNEGLAYSTNGTTYKYPSGSYTSIASNGSSYIMAGSCTSSEGAVFASADFTTWTNNTNTPIAGALNGICYGGGKYLAVGSTGAVASSVNGATWTAGTADETTVTFRSVAYGNGKYVAVGFQGKISYSSDGVSWTQANKDAATGSNFYSVKFLNNMFVAVGGSTAATGVARLVYSANGISWTDNSPGLTGYLIDIAYNGSKYVLIGKINSATVASRDFFFMTTSNITAAAFSAPALYPITNTGNILFGVTGTAAITYSNGRFVVVGNQSATPFDAYILSSADGSTWTAYSAGTSIRLRGIAASNDTFRIAGQSDGKIMAVFPSSTLPVSWLGFSARKQAQNVLLEWSTASEQGTRHFVVARSPNGSDWTMIDTIKAAGNSNLVSTYSVTDRNPVKGRNYYRLQQQDVNNNSSYSKVVMVQMDADLPIVQIYPNPATGSFLSLTLKEAGTVRIFNSTGLLQWQGTIAAGKHPLNISSWARGVYSVQCGDYTTRFVVQ